MKYFNETVNSSSDSTIPAEFDQTENTALYHLILSIYWVHNL